MLREEKAKNKHPAFALYDVVRLRKFSTTGLTVSIANRTAPTGRCAAGVSPGALCLSLGLWRVVLLQAAGLLGSPAQDELDLRVEAAQIVVRPALKGFQHGWIDTKQERFTVSHGFVPGSRAPGSRFPTSGSRFPTPGSRFVYW